MKGKTYLAIKTTYLMRNKGLTVENLKEITYR